ncbi:DUF4238 domain-containing protein [Azospirillum sp. A39]
MSEPRNHHYLPQFYLRPWCGDDGRVASYHLVNGKVMCGRKSTKSIGSERDLYACRRDGPMPRQWVETEYMTREVDTPAAEVRDKILNGEIENITHRERKTWARFMSSLFARRPDVIGPHRDAMMEIIAGVILQNPPKSQPDITEEEVFAALRRAPTGAMQDMSLTAMIYSIENSEVYDCILRGAWGRAEVAGSRLQFMTGDTPVFRVVVQENGNIVYLMSISPEVVFFCSRGSDMIIDGMTGSRAVDLVIMYNKGVVRNSRKFVVGRDCSLKCFVETYFSCGN